MKATYESASLSELNRYFRSLPAPSSNMLHGFFRASFVGPFWYRIGGFPSVHLAGLPHWQGKKFLTPTTATNILFKDGSAIEALSMTVVEAPSLVDGKPGIALRYGSEAPIPWRWVRDELRAVDEKTLLGITIVELPVLRHFRFPFQLVRES
ncbi:MAG: hypothetical protein ACRERR_03985 [Moraxellaceae bacterium]